MIARYPGNKEKVSRSIAAQFPTFYDDYVEPFVGNGALLWYVHNGASISINDSHPGLIDYYRRLQQGQPLIREIMELKEVSRCPIQREEIFEDMKPHRLTDGLALLYLLRHSFRELVRSGRRGIAKFDDHKAGFRVLTEAKLLQCQGILERATITCGDFRSVVALAPDDSFLFVDPPYYMPCNLSPSTGMYEHTFHKRDHRALCALLRHTKARFLLTVGMSDYERELYRYPGWNYGKIVYRTHNVKGTGASALRYHYVVRNY
jgi:DNA adenine methylase